LKSVFLDQLDAERLGTIKKKGCVSESLAQSFKEKVGFEIRETHPT
jgi:hypothetical protein